MPTDKIAQLRPGATFRLTTAGRVYKVINIIEKDGGVILTFESLHKVAHGKLHGSLNLKLITKLHPTS